MNQNKEHWAKSGWAISLGTAVFSLLLTMGYDFLKQIPILTTLGVGIKWIKNVVWNILNFNIKVWWISVTLILLIAIIYAINKLLSHNNNKTQSDKPDFYAYKEDKLKNWRWSWNWRFSLKQNNWTIADLKAHCPNCDTSMIEINDSYFRLSFSCPRCNFKSDEYLSEDPHKISMLIIDNIDRRRKSNNL